MVTAVTIGDVQQDPYTELNAVVQQDGNVFRKMWIDLVDGQWAVFQRETIDFAAASPIASYPPDNHPAWGPSQVLASSPNTAYYLYSDSSGNLNYAGVDDLVTRAEFDAFVTTMNSRGIVDAIVQAFVDEIDAVIQDRENFIAAMINVAAQVAGFTCSDGQAVTDIRPMEIVPIEPLAEQAIIVLGFSNGALAWRGSSDFTITKTTLTVNVPGCDWLSLQSAVFNSIALDGSPATHWRLANGQDLLAIP